MKLEDKEITVEQTATGIVVSRLMGDGNTVHVYVRDPEKITQAIETLVDSITGDFKTRAMLLIAKLGI